MNTKLDTDTGISCSNEVVSKENVLILKLCNSPIAYAPITFDTTFIIHTGLIAHTLLCIGAFCSDIKQHLIVAPKAVSLQWPYNYSIIVTQLLLYNIPHTSMLLPSASSSNRSMGSWFYSLELSQ